MEHLNMLDVVMRWLHITGAVVAVGGSIFAAFVLIPSAPDLPDEARKMLEKEVRRRFGRLFMLALAAMVVSGFYNYIRNEIPAHRGQGFYHGLMGVKILLAFVVFFLGSALLGRTKAFESIRRRRTFWLKANIALASAIIALAAVLSKMSDN